MSRPKLFTGWRVVAASAALWALQSMLWMQLFGNLAVELRRQFGWSRTFLSLAFVAGRAETAVIGPAQGRALRRWGATRIMRTGAVLTLFGFLGLAAVQSRWHFIAAMLVAALGISFSGFITTTSVIVGWFVRLRARALSLQTMGLALGGFAGPIAVVGFRLFGWRATLVVAGVILMVAAWWASNILGKRPEDSGEPVDGLLASDADERPAAEGVSDRHFTAAQAMRTRAFWMISLGHGSALVVVSASIAHIVLYLTEDRDFSPERAALIAGIIPVFQFIGTGLGGYLGDRINKRRIVMIAMCAHAIGLLAMAWLESGYAIAAFVVLHGVAWGSRGPQMQALRADYFGASHFAEIMGWSSLIVTIGTIVGPLVAGSLADVTGDYRLGFTIIAAIAFFGNVFWVFTSPPPLPDDHVPSTRATTSA